MSDITQTTIPTDPDPDSSSDSDVPNASEAVTVSAADLPLHCPMPGKRLWDSHPKVFLPIENSGQEKCPYCGTVYTLVGPVGGHH